MGVSTDAKLVYGIPLAAVPEYVEGGPEAGPAWMGYSGDAEDGVTLEHHCSDQDTMHIVAIDGTETTAWRGHPKRIDPSSLVSKPEWDATLRTFVAKHGLATEGEPGWWLCSWWG